jgi:alpha-L-rhamnosidase
LGINPASPGFKKIILKPQPAGDLTWAKGSYYSVRGEIASEWKLADGQFSWKVRIPPNTTAIVYVPSASDQNVMLDGIQLHNIKHEHGFVITELGSGDYSFVSDFKKQ